MAITQIELKPAGATIHGSDAQIKVVFSMEPGLGVQDGSVWCGNSKLQWAHDLVCVSQI